MRIVAIAAVLCAAFAAEAGPSIAVVVSGDDTVHSIGVTEVETWLGKHNFEIATGALDKDGTLTLANCLAIADLACARGVIEKRSKAENVVVIIANASGPKQKRDLQLSAYWIAKNRDVVSLQKMCNHCTKEVLPATLDALMADLSHLVPAMTGRIKVTSDPPGLLVLVDNDAAGMTPLDREVTPGSHAIAVSVDGKVVAQREITVTAGETAPVSLVAPPAVTSPLPPPPPPAPRVIVRRSRVVPAVMVGLGLAGIATGAVMYAEGGPTGKSYMYTDLRTPGEVVAAGGGAIALVGFILFLRGGTTSAPAVAVAPGNAYIGWTGRF